MKVVIVGGGMMGLCTAMLLADDGHEVTVLERDAEAPPDPSRRSQRWERRGVNQFRMSHFFLSRFRIIIESELPGWSRPSPPPAPSATTSMANIPDEMKGGIPSRRRALRHAHRPAGRWWRRSPAGCARTRRASPSAGVPPCEALRPGRRTGTACLTSPGSGWSRARRSPPIWSIDAGGRRSALPKWLAAIGAAPVGEESEDSGFIYFGRHFRSADGQMPVMIGPLKQDWGTIGVLDPARRQRDVVGDPHCQLQGHRPPGAASPDRWAGSADSCPSPPTGSTRSRSRRPS